MCCSFKAIVNVRVIDEIDEISIIEIVKDQQGIGKELRKCKLTCKRTGSLLTCNTCCGFLTIKVFLKTKESHGITCNISPKVARAASTPCDDDGYNSFHQHHSTSYIETLPNDITQYQNII